MPSIIEEEFVYIAKSPRENAFCKIGITNDLDKRLAQYNSTTGVSKDASYEYLFTCQVSDMRQLEADLKDKFNHMRENKSREIYFYNDQLFDMYLSFIKKHSVFIKEIFVKINAKTPVKFVKKSTPTLDERGLTTKDVMQGAKKIGNDEFYTRYEDIEKEIACYPPHTWLDKTIFCNCDDAVDDNDERFSSAFALFFIKNFKELGLKKLICTHYAESDLFFQRKKIDAYIFTKDGFSDGTKEFPDGYNGSFDHPISIKILKEEADIVCTNPPFSIARDYWKLIIESGKQFLIISNVSNVINTAYIPYFKNKQVWGGYDEINWFQNPKRELVRASGFWYTNIPIKNRPRYKQIKFMPLLDIPEKYKEFDDNGILIVNNNYIPNDYDKEIAVSSRAILNGILELGYTITKEKQYEPYINKERQFARLLIQKSNI